MPTDPYIAPDPEARPRQQQNLPPGVALPPARSWRAERPGDLGAEQPHGERFGTPGPNVGYAYTLANRARERFRVGPHEPLHDVVAVVAEVAGRRAASFGRAPVMSDVNHALAVFGYDGSADAAFVETRTRLVQDASHDYSRRRALVDAVTDDLLGASGSALGPLVREWRAGLAANAGAAASRSA